MKQVTSPNDCRMQSNQHIACASVTPKMGTVAFKPTAILRTYSPQHADTSTLHYGEHIEHKRWAQRALLKYQGALRSRRRMTSEGRQAALAAVSAKISAWSAAVASLRRGDGSDSVASKASEVDPETRTQAVRRAEERKASFRGSLPASLLEVYDDRDCVAPLEQGEIVLGPKLGSGEFSNVFEVKSFKLDPHFAAMEPLDMEEMERRNHLQTHEKYRDTKKARYALKQIKDEYYENHDPDDYVQAASDLAMEAELLASLQHPNIIKLRGIAHFGAAGFFHGPSGYFLVIDRLFETLDQRLKRWRAPQRRKSWHGGMPCWSRAKVASEIVDDGKKESMDERLSIALGIAAGLDYLHKHSVIFRDLKPANIGFDVRGDVKIFDFGLSRIMPNHDDPHTDTFVMSGAGSPRYMAPECLAGRPYNLKADVYAFSIVLYQILSGITPYAFVRRISQLVSFVVEENGRPDIDESWPSSVRSMMEDSFSADVDMRPNMNTWLKGVRDTLVSLRGGRRTRLTSFAIQRRRSQLSFLQSRCDSSKGSAEDN